MIGKAILLVIGSILRIVIFIGLMIFAHIMWVHYRIITRRIDDYYQEQEFRREREQISDFKKKL